MRGQGRNKVTPKVVAGKVQKKNSHHITFNYWDHDPGYPVIDRQRPGEGCRHLLTKSDITEFIKLLPDWEELSKGLKAIVLAETDDCYGWCDEGVIGICAWDRDLWQEYSPAFFEEHAVLLERLGVATEPLPDGGVRCLFTENQAKAYQLLHILLHELGHHHDRMTTKSKISSRGEPYAEAYALKYMDAIWAGYIKRFPLY
jgi:hypothetical protein